jgi:hypothetical protein
MSYQSPRTDYGFKGDSSVGTPPGITSWGEAESFCRQLECETNVYKAQIMDLKRERDVYKLAYEEYRTLYNKLEKAIQNSVTEKQT